MSCYEWRPVRIAGFHHLAGRDILVPLTQSLYVPGKIGSTSEVLVDVGTGFYVGKPLPAATEIMRKKADMVATEVSSLTRVLTMKQSNLEVITEHLQMRGAVAEQAAAAGAS
jgi:prefoldin alpha subunit